MNVNKDKAYNALIVLCLSFFIGISGLLIGLFIYTEVLNYPKVIDRVMAIGILMGWIVFICVVMAKALRIYRNMSNESLL